MLNLSLIEKRESLMYNFMDDSHKKDFASHHKVKDKVAEILAYYRSFLVDLEAMAAFYTENDDNQIIGDDAHIKRGDYLTEDIRRLTEIHALDEQLATRRGELKEPLDLQNTVAALESEVVRLRKLREEVAEESIAAIVRGLQAEFTDKLQWVVFNAVRLHTPQLELDARLDDMLDARTKRQPR